MAFFGSCWLVMGFSGCSGPQVQQADANGPWIPSQRPISIGESQLNLMLAQISQLQMVSQESLDAAKLVGTPTHELTVPQQDYMSAEQLLHDGKAAHTARQYEQSWDKLRAAEAAFRRAEEGAVRAGLGQLERELAANYGRLLNPEVRGGRHTTGVARVSQGSVNVRNGAGTHFQVIGKAQLGDTLSILGESGEWYRVQSGTGLLGWVPKMLITLVPTP
jgi:Bacterial SH3 domain